MSWASIEQVEAHTGATSDAAMVTALAVSQAWCQRQRPDLDPYTEPAADVQHAVVIYAGLLWREKSTPQGFATYSEMGGDISTGDAMMNVYRLLGTRKPVAR